MTENYVQFNIERLRIPMQKITDYILSQAGIRQKGDIIELNAAGRG